MSALLRLRTPRLLLRDFDPSDEAAVHAFAGDPVVTRYTDWGPNTPAESAAFVRGCVAQAADPHRTAFNLAAVADGVLVGSVAVWVENVTHRRGEIGFVFHPSVWNRGYATEAARELVRFGIAELGLHRISATCHPENIGSARVLGKAGLRQEGRLRDHLLARGRWRDSLLFAVVAPGADEAASGLRSQDETAFRSSDPATGRTL
ncbi:GNAT family N-acetyltransferase [Plantactinospora sp. BB1]|uniref:GNAT family N-acetyltransferase n=1 Tax=Plantactinospora sp. BB1 TaxID=2071627 RepID=UPI0018FF0239|nr:GNAT family N-acetyltransferase [Plantactinospora sp. BB1]